MGVSRCSMKLLATAGLLVACAGSAHAQLRITQVFPGGAFASTNANADYVQIMNAGTTALNIDPYSIQVASATGSTWYVINLPSFTLQPGRRYLVQLAAAGGQGTALSPDLTASVSGLTNNTLGSAGGKVAIVNGNAALTGTCPVGGATIVDFFGAMQATATAFCGEGNAYDSAFGASNPFSYTRKCFGYQDTNDNKADFAAVQFDPTNNASGPAATMTVTANGASPSSQIPGGSIVFTASAQVCSPGATTGQNFQIDLSGSGGPTNAAMNDSGVAGDVQASDGVWTYTYAVDLNAPIGGTTAAITVSDNQLRFGQTSVAYTIVAPPPPPPANDQCENAEVVLIPDNNPVVVNGTLVDSTGVDVSNCAGVGFNDIWYQFNTGSQNGTWTLETCGTGYDTVISIHTACATSQTDGTQIACNDDSCGLQSQIFPTLAADTTYYVRFANYGAAVGATTLTITPPAPPPANDDCNGAEAIATDTALSQTFPVANVGGRTGSDSIIACTGTALANDTWYLFTTPSTDGNNGTWTVNSTGARDVAIYPATACPVSGDGNAELIACHASGAAATVVTGPIAGSTQYLVQVGTATPQTAGTVTIAFAPFTGVCCISGQPSIDTQSGCALAGGTYSGDNTTIGAGIPAATATNSTAFTFDGLAPVSSELSVSGTGLTLSNVYLQIDIAHNWMADITMQLVHVESGATATILNEDGNGNDLAGVYTIADSASADWGTGAVGGDIPVGVYRAVNFGAPSSLDAAFSGIAADGTWRLDCDDVFDLADDGFVTSWTLGFNYTNDVCNAGPSCNDLDFNNDGNIEPLDVDAYFSILGEGPCLGGDVCDSLDFNNDGNIEPEDVDAYFSVLGEGPCINN